MLSLYFLLLMGEALRMQTSGDEITQGPHSTETDVPSVPVKAEESCLICACCLGV